MFKNKVVVITGAGSGIGEALTNSFIKRGAKVVAVDLSEDNLDKLKKLHEHNKNNLMTELLDICDKDKVKKLPDKIIKRFGKVNIIINNAGIIQPFVKINDLENKAVEKVMDVNFYGMYYMTKAFLPLLLKRKEAHVVNISSMGGFLPVPGQAVYGASKAAVKLFTEGLFAELMETNVAVSVVFPGATCTNISKNSGVSDADADESKSAKKYPMLSAEKVASIIIEGIEKKKLYIHTGKDCKMMSILYRINPKYATKLIAKQMSQLLKN